MKSGCGSLTRHCQTAALAIGRTPQIAPEFNEYDAEGILRGYPPPSSFPDNRAFQKVFEAAMEKWIAGDDQARIARTLRRFPRTRPARLAIRSRKVRPIAA